MGMFVIFGLWCLVIALILQNFSSFWILPLWDFTSALLSFAYGLIYIIANIVFDLLQGITIIAVAISPAAWQCLRIVGGFLKWLIKQLLRGIFGTGSQFLSVLSWVFVMCTCLLYLENIFQIGTTDRSHDDDSVEEQNNQNARRETDQQERREILENEENENEENSNEEAEINLAVDDNDRNRIREIEAQNARQQNNNINQHLHRRRNQLFVRLPNQRERQTSESDTESDENRMLHQRNLVLLRRNQNMRLQHRHTQRQNCYTCIVCMERERNIAVFPCGHMQLCALCFDNIMRNNSLCPVCQNHIDESRKVYL
ncbi:hypothetical protein FSP39_017164 [Pinctada imbricata]|uniref:RING-type domain-containing protein n=1 Tax=Pinctada imbricata TaxID=66713 RepID=A0AA88XMY7_PINIB|nr:hypothetical protein FSP39_017164 [Pinctada imbricata]